MTPQTSGNATTAPDLRDLALLAALKTYREGVGLTDSTADITALAKQMGTTHTYLYRWLENKFQGNLGKFEAQVRAFLDTDHSKAEVSHDLVAQDFIVDQVGNFLRHTKRHGFISVGHGPAGAGKTCALRIYAAKDRTAIYLHASCWMQNRHALTRQLSKLTGIKATKTQTLDEALVARLAGSDRLIIIDNAQRLTESARRWLADFWDMTRIPIALVGNPEIERQWQKNDQHGSRVGLHRNITQDLATKTAKATAGHLLRLHFPEATGIAAVLNEASQDLASFGGCRAVVMRARLASEITQGGRVTDPQEAFRLAKTQLITAAA